MSKNTREGLDNLHETAAKIADLVAKHGVIEGSDITLPKPIYAELLAAGGVTAAEERKIQDYHTHLTTGVHLGGAELAIPHMAKHPDLKDMSITVNAGKDQISVTYQRETQSRNPVVRWGGGR